MFLGLTSLITALAISAVAIYYSVAGLAAIFAAAVIPIVVMGVCLELGKLVTAVWLHKNWHRATWWIKTYLSISVVVLMIITSMGIFGFLSKAHTDQAIITGDVSSQVALYDEQIKIERENIENAKSLIAQMDATVQGIIANGESREIKLRDGRTYVRSAAEQALQVRRSQASDRAKLTEAIEEAQNNIVELQKKKAPIAANMREVEAKVGPIKYIAQLIYGEDPDQNLLEKAVTWVIIVIIFVFDPLAVLLLIAAQMSFKWYKEEQNKLIRKDSTSEESKEEKPTEPKSIITEPVGESEPKRDQELLIRDDVEEANRKIAEIEPEFIEPAIPEEPKFDEKKPLEEWNEMIAEAERAAKEEDELEDQEIINTAHAEEKAAMQRWKSENPDKSLKTQRRLYKQGKIEELPWMEYIKAEADFNEDNDAAEAAKWALEQLEAKKKDSNLDGTPGSDSDKEDQGTLEGYIQNEEQKNSSTIWKRLKDIE